MTKIFGVNRKTNMAGTGAVLTGLGGLAGCFAMGHVDVACVVASVGAVCAGIGLFHAKDDTVIGAGATAQVVGK